MLTTRNAHILFSAVEWEAVERNHSTCYLTQLKTFTEIQQEWNKLFPPFFFFYFSQFFCTSFVDISSRPTVWLFFCRSRVCCVVRDCDSIFSFALERIFCTAKIAENVAFNLMCLGLVPRATSCMKRRVRQCSEAIVDWMACVRNWME